MLLKTGEYRVRLGEIVHWYRVAGRSSGAAPLVVVHGGPGGNVWNFERTAGPLIVD